MPLIEEVVVELGHSLVRLSETESGLHQFRSCVSFGIGCSGIVQPGEHGGGERGRIVGRNQRAKP